MQERPSLLRTGLVVGWAFVIVSLAWVWVSSLYNDAIVAGANALLPSGLSLRTLGGTIIIDMTVDGQEFRHGIDSLVLHSGLLIVLALVAGTPARSGQWRAYAGGYVAACFFLLQVIAMAIFALMLRRSINGLAVGSDVQIGFAIFWALTPLAIGAAWAYRFWLPAFRDAPESEETVPVVPDSQPAADP